MTAYTTELYTNDLQACTGSQSGAKKDLQSSKEILQYPRFAYFLVKSACEAECCCWVFANFAWTNWLVRWLHKELANGGESKKSIFSNTGFRYLKVHWASLLFIDGIEYICLILSQKKKPCWLYRACSVLLLQVQRNCTILNNTQFLWATLYFSI